MGKTRRIVAMYYTATGRSGPNGDEPGAPVQWGGDYVALLSDRPRRYIRRSVARKAARALRAAGCTGVRVARVTVYERRKAAPLPSSKEHDRARSEAMWNAAGEQVQESGDRRDWEGTEDADFDQQNYAIALDIHRDAGREKAIAELRRRYDVLAGYLMLYGGTDFVNGCRSAIAEERWCDLVESIAALEHEHVRGKRLRWGKDADGNRIAEEIEPGRYHIPADLYPGHPFDAKKEQ